MAYCARLTSGRVVRLVGESTQRAVLFSRSALKIYYSAASPINIQPSRLFFKLSNCLQSPSLAVPELGLLFDAGAPLRSLAALDTIVLSHGHVDHIGSLPALLGIRGLQGKARPPRVIMPAEIEADLTAALAALSRLQRSPLEIEPIGMRPGDEIALRGDLRIRAVRTFRPVPSLGYVVVRLASRASPSGCAVHS